MSRPNSPCEEVLAKMILGASFGIDILLQPSKDAFENNIEPLLAVIDSRIPCRLLLSNPAKLNYFELNDELLIQHETKLRIEFLERMNSHLNVRIEVVAENRTID